MPLTREIQFWKWLPFVFRNRVSFTEVIASTSRKDVLLVATQTEARVGTFFTAQRSHLFNMKPHAQAILKPVETFTLGCEALIKVDIHLDRDQSTISQWKFIQASDFRHENALSCNFNDLMHAFLGLSLIHI